jgi:5-methylcytosine-specific restriction endonuclease McrA|tara:strand:- start:557 stop:856 length:300 start_codon:yes stop_codon:yes gene_type:complete
MPYVNKKRPYKKEYQQEKARKEKKARAARARARYALDKDGVDRKGKDIDHKKPLSKGGSNKRSNLRLVKPSSNRSFSRNSDHTVKTNKPKKKRTTKKKK